MEETMTVTIILKSGAKIDVKCSECSIRTLIDAPYEIEFKDVTYNKILYLNMEEVAAIIRP